MKYEVLKRSHLKRNIIIAVLVVSLISPLILNFTQAKYRTTESIPLIQGTINFSPSDLNIVAMYLNQDGAIPAGQTDIAPKFGYTLNEEQSFCEVNDEKIDNAAFTYENGLLGFYNLNRKGTKCSVYFDLIPDSEKPTLSIVTSSTDNSITVIANATDNIGIYYYYYKIDNEEEVRLEENSYTFDNLEKDSVHNITVRVEDAAGNEESVNKEVTVGYKVGDVILASANPPAGKTTDWTNNGQGVTYYYTGANPDNWFYFGGFYWRIIRINGDGTIRMIYQGTSANTTGTSTQIGTSAFNSTRTDNMYVGFKYTQNEVHGTKTNSTILGTDTSTDTKTLNGWYRASLLEYANYIDGNAGFCGDRTPSTSDSSSNGSGGTGTTKTYYGAYIRLVTNNSPSLQCGNSADIYTTEGSSTGNGVLTYPIGLISADEVILTGITWNNDTTESYLYTGQAYWTLSPSRHDNFGSREFIVSIYGSLGFDLTNVTYGVRPVINLKSSILLEGDGSVNTPFKIVGT